MTISAQVDRTAVHPGDPINVKVWVQGQPDQRVQGARVELCAKNRYREQERDYDHDSSGHDRTRTVTRVHEHVTMWVPLPAAHDGPVAFGEHDVTLYVPP